jgi:hypothetical protein
MQLRAGQSKVDSIVIKLKFSHAEFQIQSWRPVHGMFHAQPDAVKVAIIVNHLTSTTLATALLTDV